MEVSHPSWSSQENAYTFQFTGKVPIVEDYECVFDVSGLNTSQLEGLAIIDDILTVFLDKTKRYFVTPLQKETVKKHLRHYIAEVPTFPTDGLSYKPIWKPIFLKLKSNEFSLFWSVQEWKQNETLIRPDFFRSKSPAPQSPELKPNLRTIHIQNAVDGLVPVGDLPLSDLPPLNFGDAVPQRRDIRRRIREARIKVELAKLKVNLMEQKYYRHYNESGPAIHDESSLEGSDSETDLSVGKYSYS